MAILAKPLDYTDKDFDSIRIRVFDAIHSAFPGWTERDKRDLGNLLVESFAFVLDVLLKYQDNQAGETRWTQAVLRESAISAAKLIGFKPTGATASTAPVTVSLVEGVAAAAVPIPEGTVIRTNQVGAVVRFTTLEYAEIPAGASSVEVLAENSELRTEVYAGNRGPNHEIQLTATPYLDESLVVSAAEGLFTEVDNFLESSASDLHYTVTVDGDDRATIRFGDDVSGAIPTGAIDISYRIGGGSGGVVDAGTLTVVEGRFLDGLGNAVSLVASNAEKSSIAVSRQTLEEIKVAAPESLRVLERTISREDYEIRARAFPEVARALFLTSDNDPAIQENAGILFVVPVDGSTPTTTLLDAIHTDVTETYPGPPTFRVSVLPALYKSIDISTVLHFRKDADPVVVANRVRAALAQSFALTTAEGLENDAVRFGFYFQEEEGSAEGFLPWSEVFNTIRDTDGVLKVADTADRLLINGSDSDADLLLREFPKLGTVTIINAATGTAV